MLQRASNVKPLHFILSTSHSFVCIRIMEYELFKFAKEL